MKRRIGVAADDITGSNDIGVMFAKNGYRVKVVSLADKPSQQDFDETDVLVINTASRLDDKETAAQKNRKTAAFLKSMACDMVFTKTCSVFRGNVGASFDAVQDVLEVSNSAVIAAFPRNGRTTVEGVHLLNGVPVAKTHFAKDPVTPLKYSRLDELIHQQSDRECACFTLPMYGVDEQNTYEELKSKASYIVFDAVTQKDLSKAAYIIKDEKNICGASAICEELPEAWGEKSTPVRYTDINSNNKGTVVFAGSLTPQTAAQVRYLEEKGINKVVLQSTRLLSAESREKEVRKAVEYAAGIIDNGENVLIYASRETESVRRESEKLGITEIEAGRNISLAFEMLAKCILDVSGTDKYAVAGGETSDAVSRGLGVRAMRIWQEIEAGVPLMTADLENGKRLKLVFKSGSFGSETFLAKAINEVN